MEVSRGVWHMRVNQRWVDIYSDNDGKLRRRQRTNWRQGLSDRAIAELVPLEVYVPGNLCLHFWSTVVALVIVSIYDPIRLLWRRALRYPVLFLVMLCVLAFDGGAWVWSNRPRREGDKLDMPREPSLVIEYLKARKKGVCPLITVREETDG